ncbi:MAG: signal peptidase II [Coriobacteriales bacterium]|jgi:signal peptidase II|nr:signal peptidase II [Coriobacteriales bacterium]
MGKQLPTEQPEQPSESQARPRCSIAKGYALALFLILVILLVAADRFSKLAIAATLNVGESFVFIPGIVEFVFVENRGGAFGLFAGAGPLFLIVAAVVVTIALVYLLKAKELRPLVVVSLALIVSGALGNAYDRLMSGVVTDFIHTLFVEFAVFNVADCCLTIGEVLLACCIIGHMLANRPGALGRGAGNGTA